MLIFSELCYKLQKPRCYIRCNSKAENATIFFKVYLLYVVSNKQIFRVIQHLAVSFAHVLLLLLCVERKLIFLNEIIGASMQ